MRVERFEAVDSSTIPLRAARVARDAMRPSTGVAKTRDSDAGRRLGVLRTALSDDTLWRGTDASDVDSRVDHGAIIQQRCDKKRTTDRDTSRSDQIR